MVVQKLSQADWNYTFYRSADGFVLSVLCGTVGMFELNIPLNREEEALYLGDSAGLERLANRIRSSPNDYATRSVEITEGSLDIPASVAGGMPCPREGWWYTPAKVGSRRHFQQGETLPNVDGSAYGATFWIWDRVQH